jgi:hypothetical protein
MKTYLSLLVCATCFAPSAFALEKTPFGKSYDEVKLKEAISLPMPKLIEFISKSADIRLVPVRNNLDKEVPPTELETNKLVQKVKLPIPKHLEDAVGSSHRSAGLTILPKDPDIKVKRTTIFVNEFADSYTLVHEYMHTLLNATPGAHAIVSQMDAYRPTSKADFYFDKVLGNKLLLNDAKWRTELIEAVSESIDVYIKLVEQTTSEEIIIEKTLADLITPESPHFSKLRKDLGHQYQNYFMDAVIVKNFDASLDRVGFIKTEVVQMQAISEADRQKDLAAIAKMEDKLRDFRASVVELQKWVKPAPAK